MGWCGTGTSSQTPAGYPPGVTRLLSDADFPAPISDRFLEDYVVGSTYEYGTIAIEADAIVEFATAFDPQPFHVDPAAAALGAYGGLIASGWHTASLMMRVLVDHVISSVASLGSSGCDELRWLLPVRPGDELSVRFEVLDCRPSRSKPDRGIVRARVEVRNQHGQVAMSVLTTIFLLTRAA